MKKMLLFILVLLFLLFLSGGILACIGAFSSDYKNLFQIGERLLAISSCLFVGICIGVGCTGDDD